MQNGNPNPNQPLSASAGQVRVQKEVADQVMLPESRRTLSQANFSEGGQATIEIPRDTSVKRMQVSVDLGVTVTYVAGAPLLSPLGVASKLFPQFSILADGSRSVKVLDLYMQRCMQSMNSGGFGRRAYATGAAIAASSSQPTIEWLEGAPAYPLNNEDLIVNESIGIDFELPWAYQRGESASQLYTRNLASCIIQLGFGSSQSLLEDGNGAVVAYNVVRATLTPTIIEDRGASVANGAFDYTQTVIRRSFSSQVSDFAFDLNTGNKLLGLSLMARNGDASRSLSDTVIRGLNLVVNGSTSIQKTDFKSLMNDNKQRYGVADDQFSSGLHGLLGFARMSLIKGGDILSGLDTRLTSGVSQVQLLASTAPASGVDPADYTNSVELSVMQETLIPVPVKS